MNSTPENTTPDIKENPVTETNEAVIHEALSVIDKALGQMMSRELVSSGEITDVLLDVRTLLTMPPKTDLTLDRSVVVATIEPTTV